jgi:hypothetical protein
LGRGGDPPELESLGYPSLLNVADANREGLVAVVEQGVRFSQNYIAKGKPTSDSARMRRRLFNVFMRDRYNNFASSLDIEAALGVKMPHLAGYGPHWEKYFVDCELRDFLDTITVVASKLRQLRETTRLGQWVRLVKEIFNEENVHYRLDERGGVHFAIDAEFEHNQACAIAALQGSRYGAARAHFEAGQKALDASSPQTREAIRQTFEAAETVFKLMFSDVTQLGVTEITKKLQPLVKDRFQGSERNSAVQLAEGFSKWVVGAHQYRHGQGVEEPDNPSITTTVLSVSLGATYVRWLAELDAIILREP